MARILITTVYSIDSIVLAITKLSIGKVLLLVDKLPNQEQRRMIRKLSESFGKVIGITERKIELYDIASVSQDIVSLIDSLPLGEEIYVNVTPGRKTQALGVLFACYKRNLRIKRIMYITEEKGEIIDLPILSFDISESQQALLKALDAASKKVSITTLSRNLKISRAMLYRNLKSLKEKGLIEEKDGVLTLTDAGKIGKL